jgi:hypothetical protein
LVTRHYLESAEGSLHAYRKRARRYLEFVWRGKPETKNSADMNSSIAFQTQLAKHMMLIGRNALTGAVIVELEFWVSERNSGEVQSLAKHYLDLIHRPVPGSGVKPKHLMLRDDSQIQYLTCIHNGRGGENGVSIRARRLKDFFADLALFQKLESGDVESEDESWREEIESKDEWNDRPIEEYRDFKNRRPQFEAAFGENQYKKWELIHRQAAQESILRGRKPTLSQLRAIFAPRFHQYRNHKEFKRVLEATAVMIRSVYENTFLSMDFGPRALQEGESTQFRERVRAALNNARNRYKLLFPLLTQCAVTILYVPPKKAIKVDLDNLARKFIVPGVHEILKPPATPREFFVELNEGETMDALTQQLLEGWRNTQKFHIAYYQIFCLPRMKEDPEKGSVRLILHDGENMKTTWKTLETALDKWGDSMKSDSGPSYWRY